MRAALYFSRCPLLQQPSSFAQARRIIKTDGFGLRGLNKGLTSTLGRHGVFNMIYFGFYFNVKDAVPTSPVMQPDANLDRTPLFAASGLHRSRPPGLTGESPVFGSSEPAGLSREEAQIREELVRSAPLIPHLFAPHNILKVSGYTSGRLRRPKQKLILFNGNVAIRPFHMYKLGALF